MGSCHAHAPQLQLFSKGFSKWAKPQRSGQPTQICTVLPAVHRDQRWRYLPVLSSNIKVVLHYIAH